MPDTTPRAPAPASVYTHLGTSAAATSDDEARGTLRLRADLRQPGGLLAAPIGVLTLDAAAQIVHIHTAAAPTRIEVHVFEPAGDVGALSIRSRIARRGRGQVYTEARIVDADRPERVVAFSTTTFVVTGPPTGISYQHPAPAADDSPRPPLFEAFGGTRQPDGTFVVRALDSDTRRLHSGVMQANAEAAALALVEDRGGDLPVMTEFLGTTVLTEGRAGPFSVQPELLAIDGRSAGVRVEIHDDGSDGRFIGLVTVRVRIGTN
jgi:acyl-coenzyme A thioesterase PaaI-like protein